MQSYAVNLCDNASWLLTDFSHLNFGIRKFHSSFMELFSSSLSAFQPHTPDRLVIRNTQIVGYPIALRVSFVSQIEGSEPQDRWFK